MYSPFTTSRKLLQLLSHGARARRNDGCFYLASGAWHPRSVFGPVQNIMEGLDYAFHVPGQAGQEPLEPTSGVDLDLVIQRHLQHIKVNNLHNLKLVGWSYGGMVAQSLAEHLLAEDAKRPLGVPKLLDRIILFDAFVIPAGKSAPEMMMQFDAEHGTQIASAFSSMALDLMQQSMTLPEAMWRNDFMPVGPEDATQEEQDAGLRLLVPHPIATYLLPIHGEQRNYARFWQAVERGTLPVSYIVGTRDRCMKDSRLWEWIASSILGATPDNPSRLLLKAPVFHEAWLAARQQTILVRAILEAAGMSDLPDIVPAAFADAQEQEQVVGERIAAVLQALASQSAA